jgi:hypothetical protein
MDTRTFVIEMSATNAADQLCHQRGRAGALPRSGPRHDLCLGLFSTINPRLIGAPATIESALSQLDANGLLARTGKLADNATIQDGIAGGIRLNSIIIAARGTKLAAFLGE